MTKREIRMYSIESLIKNLTAPKNVRRCLRPENERLIRQIITGRRQAFIF